MKELDFSSIFLPQCNYRITKLVRQFWCNESYSYRDRPRPDHGFLLVDRGNILFVTERGELLAEEGDVFFLPKGSRYEACILPSYGETVDLLVNFDADLPSLCPKEPMKLIHTQSQALLDQFRQTVSLSLRGEGDAFRRQGQFFFLLDHLLSDIKCCSKEKTQLLARAQKLLCQREELSVRQIADMCGISESNLRNAFTKAYGLSPQQYRIQLKISKAKFLLESTDLSVYEIAEELNFYDEAYFCKMFRKYVGCSPRKYIAHKSI